MKSNKGFTLIELLAVIVILAIIALITLPIVIRIIDNAKKGAAEDSTYGVIETARLFWTVNQADFSVSKQNVTFTCASTGVCSGTINKTNDGGLTQTASTVTLDIDGTKPKAGTVTINGTAGTVAVKGLKFGDYTCTNVTTTGTGTSAVDTVNTKVTCS